MTNEERNDGIQLIRDQKFEEAYNYYAKLYLDTKDDEALYLKSLIDFSYLKKNLDETTKAFTLLADGNSKFKGPSLHLCTLIYNMQGDNLSTIKYGEQALKTKGPVELNSDLKLEILSAIAVSYYSLDGRTNLLKALDYIDQALEIEDDENLNITKADILIALEKFDSAAELLESFQTKFGTNGSFYLVRESLAYAKGIKVLDKEHKLTDEAKEDFLSALDLLDFCENYEVPLDTVNSKRASIYTALGEYEKAIKCLDEIKNENNEIAILIEKLKVCDLCDKKEEAIKYCLDYLSTHNSEDNWMIEYSLGFTYFKGAKTKEELLEAKKYYLSSYNASKELFILYELFFVNNQLGCFEENFNLVKEAYDEKRDEDGRIAYYYATMAQILDYSYEFVNKLFYEAREKGYLEETEYLDEVTSICDNPKIYYKAIKQLNKVELTDPWSLRKMAIRYLYGEDGFKPNYKKAYEYYVASDKKASRTCIKTSFARYYEIAKKDYNEAFKLYSEAYELYKNDPFPACHCAVGYYAYALYFGIGTEKNEEE